MTHTRNGRKAMGAAAPDLGQLADKPTTRRKRGRKAASSDGADGWAANQRREGSVGLDIPGAFAPSPVGVEARDAGPEQSDELDEAQAEAHISIAMGARTDEEQSESCPPEESTDDDDESDSCPEERIAEPGPEPSACPNIGRASHQARSPTPFEFRAAEPVFEGERIDPSTTPFHTPSRKARAHSQKGVYRLEGPRFFSPDVLDKYDNLYIGFYESGTEPEPEPESENRSDETLKQTAKLKKKSEAQQRAEDMTYLNEIIKDRKRRRRLQEMLPDIIPNNKSLLTEMREALRESSDEELLLSEWEIESESVPVSPKAGPSGLTQKAKDSESVAESEPTEYNGPSYFAKGKWISDEVHDQRVAYKAKETEKVTLTPAEGREKPPKAPKKKARPSIGITIDEIRPTRATPKPLEKAGSPALKASVTALPAGGYFADKMRARTQLANPNKVATKTEHKRQDSTSSSSASESSESSSSSEDNSSSDYSDGSSKRAKKRRNAKKSDKYREKAQKLKREVRRARRVKAQLIEPTPYHGQADYDELEIWDYEVDEWLRESGYKGRKAVRQIKQFLKGKAARWYMDFVAPNPQDHTVDSIKMGLFSYCFPPNMKSKLRNEFKYAKQGNKRFIDYLRELKRLQRRIPDITDRQICIKLWDTVHLYIKVKWVEAGLNAEESDLETLTESAERFEAAEEVKRQIDERRDRHRNKRDEQRQPSSYEPKKASGHAPRPEGGYRNAGPSSKGQGSSNKPKGADHKSKPPKPRNDKQKLTREERNALRAEGKCFECKEPGHTVKDCPKRNTAKPSGLFSAAVRPDYDLIERLRKEREQTLLPVASIRPATLEDDSDDSYGTLDDVTPGGSLLTEILDELSPYARIILAENDRLEVIDESSRNTCIMYVEIAQQVRDTYLETVQRCQRTESENNQPLETILEEPEAKEEATEGWEDFAWSDSDNDESQVKGKKRAEQPTKNLERNAAKPKDITRKMPKPLVVEATINAQTVRALIDSGSLGDFISTTVVDQLKLERETLAKPIGLQMAVAGSRSSINFSVTAEFGYQGIRDARRFDVINIDNYDLILGTPFLYQYKVTLGLNPPTVTVGTKTPESIQGVSALVIESLAAEIFEEKIEERRAALREYGQDLCKTMEETALPPFRAINHTIPLIDESKRYRTRRVQCPKPLEELWDNKRDAYLSTNRWEYRAGSNATPMLILMKKSKDGKKAVRTVLDKREINANTYKLASPLPDINDILMEVSRHPYRSLIDGKDAYEQIRVIPEHVERTLFMTPNGTMVSQVMQQGDCNAGATYQALMNHIFSEYIGKFMYVYLDDIIVFSDTAEEHEKHVKLVFDVLRREKLYLSPNKMQLFANRLEILGHVITDEGIAMDPHKVDAIEKWKIPTSKEQLMSFLGAVGYLAPNCPGIRIPMGVLSKRASANQTWRWEATEQRAFDEIRKIVGDYRNHNRVALDYSPGAPSINLVTDACCTGASGVVCQGEDLRTAKIVAFWSGKFTTTQQNYPVHEQELLAIKESLERFQNLLHGVRVRVFTDHKGLEFFATQKRMSARQTRWMEKINEFDIEIKYIPGETNIFADALSRIYSDEPEGVVRSKSEYVHETDSESQHILVGSVATNGLSTSPLTEPLYVAGATESEAKDQGNPPAEQAPRRSQRAKKPVEKYLNQPQRKRRTARENKPSTEAKAEAEKPTETLECQPEVKETQSETQPPESRLVQCVTEFALPESLVGRYAEDPVFKSIIEEPSRYRNYETISGALYLRKDDNLLLCIPDIKIGERTAREVIITHAHSILAHLGARKTLQWLRTQVWWKTMVSDVIDYCQSCHTCQAHKASTQSPMGLLHAMPMPTYPWQSIGIDFVGPLPESETRYGKFDMIMTVVDNLTRMVHLIPTRQDYKAKDIAEVIFEHIYKLHGMPERIVSDRDSLFTSIFWTRLAELTKTELRMSSAYHPETDGMTERAQRTYTSLLRMCAGARQTEWASHLAGIEFAINSARSESTGLSPFYLNYGRTPSPMVFKVDAKYPGIREHIERIKLAIMTAHDAILNARVKMTRQANQHRRPAEFETGDLVYISTKNIRLPKGFARKLAPKYVGPYKITRVITPGATYEVELPKELKARGIHPVFHASKLRVHVPVDDRRFPGREFNQIATLGDVPQERAVDRITSHQGKGRKAIFELLWKTGDRTWEPYRTVRHLEALDAYCEAQGVKSIRTLPAGAEGELAESEPEEMLSCLIWLKPVSTTRHKSSDEKDEKDSPSVTCSSTSYPPAPPVANPSLPAENMDQNSHVSINALEVLLKAQAEMHTTSANALIRLAGMKVNGGHETRRRRRARAKAAQEAGENPKNKKGRNKTAKKPRTEPNPSANQQTGQPSGIAWMDAELDLAGASVLNGQDLLSFDSNGAPNPPIPAYTPTQAANTLDPTHSTQANQPDTALGSFTPHESHVPTGQSSLPTQNPPANGPQGEEETINYEEDYSMQDAGGGH